MSEPRTCTRCGTPDLTEACPVCTAWWEQRPPAESLTREQRLSEFRSWGPILEIDWPKVHQRIEELVGRPVWTHEMGTDRLPYLEHEIITGEHPTMDGVLAKLPADKPVIVVRTESADGE